MTENLILVGAFIWRVAVRGLELFVFSKIYIERDRFASRHHCYSGVSSGLSSIGDPSDGYHREAAWGFGQGLSDYFAYVNTAARIG